MRLDTERRDYEKTVEAVELQRNAYFDELKKEKWKVMDIEHEKYSLEEKLKSLKGKLQNYHGSRSTTKSKPGLPRSSSAHLLF